MSFIDITADSLFAWDVGNDPTIKKMGDCSVKVCATVDTDSNCSLAANYRRDDLPPLSRTKSMEPSPLILENGRFFEHNSYLFGINSTSRIVSNLPQLHR